MSDPFVAALPGAVATVVAGIVGAYAVLHKDKPPVQNGGNDRALNNEARVPSPAVARSRSRLSAVRVAGLSILLGFIVLVVAFWAGLSQQNRLKKEALDSQVSAQTKSYEALISAGLSDNKTYVMPSIVMLVTVEKSPDGQSVITDQKSIYQIHALRDISSTRNDQQHVFDEEYNSRYPMTRIPGSDVETVTDRDFPNKWSVRFNDSQGNRKTIVTGVEHKRPFNQQVTGGLCMFPTIGVNEECFCYPNSSDDVIGQLLIIVQSKTINLNAHGSMEAVLKRADGTSVPIDATAQTLGDGSLVPSTIVARFDDIQKHDIAGIKVAW